MLTMFLEVLRLTMGLLVAAWHRPIADFISDREHSLVLAFRQRGMRLPAALTRETARDLYFWIGIFIVIVELLRIYQLR